MSKKLSIEVIKRGLKDWDCNVRIAVMYACSGRTDIPLDVIECGLKDFDGNVKVKIAAIDALSGRTDIPLDVIERWFKDDDYCVRTAAINACSGRTDIPLDVIERGVKDGDCNVRIAAMNALSGRTDIPLDVIERWFKDDDYYVRATATRLYAERNIEIPIIRTIEPPERVFKKCCGGVIVVAEIPKNAQVRGRYDGKCRTNKAKIVDIIGEFAGEKVGISLWDKRTAYYIGDEIFVEDFNMSNVECSTGYNFFCTIEQALAY